MNNTPVQLLTIQEAAKYLKVSTKTLRRWDSAGVISPVRTTGGHRRYNISDLNNLKQGRKAKRQVIHPAIHTTSVKSTNNLENTQNIPLPQIENKPAIS